MATQELTLELPEKIFHQFARMAKITHQSIESLGIQSLSGNLPPLVDNAPFSMQAGLQAMQTFSIEVIAQNSAKSSANNATTTPFSLTRISATNRFNGP